MRTRSYFYLTGVVVAIVISLLFWDQPIQDRMVVGGKFSKVDQINFYTTSRKAIVSPLCGCEAELPRQSWAGVVALGNKFKLSFETSSGWYWFDLLSGIPGLIGDETRVAMRVTLHHSEESRIKNGWPAVVPEFSAYGLQVLANKPITISPDRNFPQIAWLPPADSHSSVQFGTPIGVPLRIESNVMVTQNSDVRTNIQEAQFSPVFDAMGPRIEINIPSGSHLRVIAAHSQKDDLVPEWEETGVTKVVVAVPFAARSYFYGTEGSERSEDLDVTETLPKPINTKGVFHLEAVEEVGRLPYGNLERSIDRDKHVIRDVEVPFAISTPHGVFSSKMSMIFRLPFLAPRRGIQLYGELAKLEARGISGDFLVGSKPLPVAAPSELVLRDVVPIRQRKDYVSVPFGFDMDSGGALSFQAKTSFELNGEKVHPGAITVGQIIGIVGVLLGIVVALLEVASWIRVDRPTVNQKRWGQVSKYDKNRPTSAKDGAPHPAYSEFHKIWGQVEKSYICRLTVHTHTF